MIVKCQQCQTRFKIPDEKVKDTGVKVRCTKCQHTFRVFRGPNGEATTMPVAGAPAPTALGGAPGPTAQYPARVSMAAAAPQLPLARPPPPTDPFARFGAAPSMDTGARPPPPPPLPVPTLSAQAPSTMGYADEFDSPTRVGMLPLPAMAKLSNAPLGLVMPAGGAGGIDVPVDDFNMASFDEPASAAAAAPPPPVAVDVDPFAGFGEAAAPPVAPPPAADPFASFSDDLGGPGAGAPEAGPPAGYEPTGPVPAADPAGADPFASFGGEPTATGGMAPDAGAMTDYQQTGYDQTGAMPAADAMSTYEQPGAMPAADAMSADPFAGYGPPSPDAGGAMPASTAYGDLGAAPGPTAEMPAQDGYGGYPGYDGASPDVTAQITAAPTDPFSAFGAAAPADSQETQVGAPDPAAWAGAATAQEPAYAPGATDQVPAWVPPAGEAAAAEPGGQQPWDFSSSVPAEPAPAESFDFSGSQLRESNEAPRSLPDPFASAPPAAPAAAELFGAPGAPALQKTVPAYPNPLKAAAAPAPAPPAPPAPAEVSFGASAPGEVSFGASPDQAAETTTNPSFDFKSLGTDAFAAPPPADPFASASADAGPASGAVDRSDLFGSLPPPPPSAPQPDLGPDGLPVPTASLGKIQLVKKPASEVGAPPPPAPAEAPAAPVEVEPPPPVVPVAPAELAAPDADARLRRRRAVGVVVNIAVAALVLLVVGVLGTIYVNEGKVAWSSLSWSRFQEYLALGQDLVTVDISNGLYDTRGGRPIFYVRGEVLNRGDATVPVRVEAIILDEGDKVVGSGTGWAGAAPTPEDLYGLATPPDLEQLQVRLVREVKAVSRNAPAPFLVPFLEYPSDLRSVRVRVKLTAVKDGPPQTATR